jgi:arylsulfate sulfotransferase
MTFMTNLHMHRRFNYKKTLIVMGAVLSLLILFVLLFLLRPAYSASAKTISFVKDTVSKQQKIERYLRAAYQSGKFTFMAPLVVQDPYQTAPLTALLIFDTPENRQISIHVPGKTPEAAVDYIFPGFQKHHEVPIYGLYAGALNHVTMRMQMQNGESAQTEVDLQTEPLPLYLNTFTVDIVNRDRYSPGFNFAFLARRQLVFDINGDVRWYSVEQLWQVFSKLNNGRFMRAYIVDGREGDIMMEQDLLGKIYAIYSIADGIHHDIYELPTGNLLITSADMKSTTIEDYIIEVDRNNGHIVRSFDLKNILDPGRSRQVVGLPQNDWLHLNSIVYDPTDQSIIISSKGQSAVVKLSYPGMQIKWILGPHDNWRPKYQPYLLTPLGKNFEWPWSQHHATLYSPDVLGDGFVDILLFDNANFRSFESAFAYPPSEWYSMVAHYRIDEANRTVELVWEYGRERGSAIFSAARGSAYHLANGDVLGTWGDIYKDDEGNPVAISSAGVTAQTKVIEVDPSNNNVVFECSAGAETYRTLRAGLYDGYSEGNALISTPLSDTTGNDLVDRSVIAWRDVRRWTYTDPVMLAIRRFGRKILAAIK